MELIGQEIYENLSFTHFNYSDNFLQRLNYTLLIFLNVCKIV